MIAHVPLFSPAVTHSLYQLRLIPPLYLVIPYED